MARQSRFSWVIDWVGPVRALKLMALYPPYLGAGVRVDAVDVDLRSVSVSMALHRWNMNAVGSHFGGSLYSLCDPWFMLLLIARLGPDFIVWDKSATIDFIAPGRGRVSAHFAISAEQEQEIRDTVAREGKIRPTLTALVKAEDGSVVCRVEKTLSIRRKP